MKNFISKSPFRQRMVNAITILFFSVLSFLCGQVAHGQVKGSVFRDYNASGNHDATSTFLEPHVQGVSVRATLKNGTSFTTQTNAVGEYAFTAGQLPAGSDVRVEFTLASKSNFGPVGPSNGSSVQFVIAGATAEAHLGINNPEDYCGTETPQMVTACYLFGMHDDPAVANDPVLVSFPYTAGSSSRTQAEGYYLPDTHEMKVPSRFLGTAYSLTYDRRRKEVYSAAYMKRHANYGPHGPAAVYTSPMNGSSANLLVNLSNVFGPNTAGPDIHNTNDHFLDYQILRNISGWEKDTLDTWDAVGKTSLGGMDIDNNDIDNPRLYVMNLYDRNLYEIPLRQPFNPSAIRRIPVPTTTVPGAKKGTDIRPFAVKYHHGKVYVGLVNSAESSQDSLDLKAYVYALDPATFTFEATPYLEVPLNYTRQLQTPAANQSSAWRPWSPYFKAIPEFPKFNWDYPVYPQAILSDIQFDGEDMLLGFKDRFGDQMGYGTRSNPNLPTAYYHGVPSGDVLRIAKTVTGWEVENNGSVGGRTSATGVGNGPNGTGEFYGDDYYDPFHNETFLGSVKQVQGVPTVVATTYDPILIPNSVFQGAGTGGMRWFKNNDGSFERGYVLVTGGSNQSPENPYFGKSAGVGSIELICGEAPLEIGNRVWLDLNKNGLQDAGEKGMAGITVELYKDGQKVGEQITAADGSYYFNKATMGGETTIVPGGAYELRIPRVLGSNKQPADPFVAFSNVVVPNASMLNSDGIILNNNASISLKASYSGDNQHNFDFAFTCALPVDFTITSKPCTCNGGSSNSDGTITLSGFTPTFRYDIVMGDAYTGEKTYATATAIPEGGIISQSKPNPDKAFQNYTVRIFIDETCYVDVLARLDQKECVCPQVCPPIQLVVPKK